MYANTQKAWSLLTAALALAGCQAEITGPAGGSTGLSGDPPSNAATGSGGGGSTPSPAQCASGPSDPGPAPIRRLNRLEYDNAVRDLLGTKLTPAMAFPTEEIVLGFNDNAQALTVSPALTEQYLEAAEQLATEAVTNRYADFLTCDPAVT